MKTKPIVIFIILLLMSSLACNLTSERANEQAQAAVATAAVVGQQAEELAATAAVVAATVAAQGGDILATIEAADITMPDMAALRSRVQSILPDENGNVSLTLTDAELSNVVEDQQATTTTADEQTIALQNPGVRFTNGTILFQGEVTQPIEAQLSVSFRPIVEDGALRFEAEGASLGGINVPATLLQTAESRLNNTLGEAMTHLPEGVTLQAVIVGEGTLTIMAHHEG